MGFGISNLINFFTQKALISWDATTSVAPGEIYAEVKIGEYHKYSNDVTENAMEDGSIIDEHIISKPIELTLQIQETNSAKMLTAFGLGTKNLDTFEQLVKLCENKVELTITTEHKQYKHMIIKNMPIAHKAPYKDTLDISIDLIQLNFSNLQSSLYKAIDKATSMAALPTINAGMQQPKTP